MTGDTREIIYENEHDAVNDFIRRKQAMDRSPRTLNAYSRTLQVFFHEEFRDDDDRERVGEVVDDVHLAAVDGVVQQVGSDDLEP